MQTSFSPVQLADPDTAESAAILRTWGGRPSDVILHGSGIARNVKG
jgi:hypothetical protein